ncbi:MAG: MgtC/SapB family protein [Candidatus Aenigmatarchaeota archaeon]
MEEFLIKVALIIILSGIIGLERESRHKSAGVRTHILVGLAAFTFTYFSMDFFEKQDAARIIANILVGMGFIGAGVIIKEKIEEKVIGVTTAASLWFVSAIGMLVGLGYLLEASILSLISLLLLLSKEIYSLLYKKYKW